MRILVVSDLHYRLPHYDWLVGGLRAGRRRRPRRRPRRRRQPRAARRADRGARRTTSARLADPHRRAVVARATTTSTARARTASRSPAGCAAPTTARCTSTAPASTSATPASRSAPGGTARSPGRRSPPSSPRRPSTGPARWVWVYHAPPAGTPLCNDGRRTFPDQDLADWIAEHQPGHRAVRAHPPGAVGERRVVARPARAARGSSTPASRSARCRRTSPSTPRPRTAHWFGVFESETISLA